MNKSQEGVAAKPQTSINQNAPHQPFLAFFQRWEWILVALIIAVVVPTPGFPLFSQCTKPFARIFRTFMEIV